MKIKADMKEIYAQGLANNQDFYGKGVYDFLERWADLMENKALVDGLSMEGVINTYAEELSHTADTDGITAFMYGSAVSILSQVWEYGELLQNWHNSLYSGTGTGTVNLAVYTKV